MAIKNSLALYIHIPYCIKKCNYCDFVSFKYAPHKLEAYVNCLLEEINIFCKNIGNNRLTVSTVYIGGGTPSLLTPEELKSITSTLNQCFDLNGVTEFTTEANPETITFEKFKEYEALGVNRISMGTQSFNDKTLKILGRVHDSSKIYKSFYILRKAGFKNINIDLMFALPNETISETIFSLKEAVKLNPEHISYYSLMIEENTPFFKMRDKLNLPDNNTEFLEYKRGMEILKKNGYEQYEISNFAKPGFRSKHNIQYWKNLPYIGFGVSAASYIARVRYKNLSNIAKYCSEIKKGNLPIDFREHLIGKEAKAEHIIMNLRMTDGADKKLYYTRFGNFMETDFKKTIDKLKTIKLIKENKNRLALTKKGLFVANTVFMEFLP